MSGVSRDQSSNLRQRPRSARDRPVRDPVYGAPDLTGSDGPDKTAADNNASADPTKVGTNATFQLGYAYNDSGTVKKKEAALYDAPNTDSKSFETAALGLEGRDANTYFGSVKWGYTKSGASDVTISDIELAAMGVPTQNFLQPAQLWNDSKTRGTLDVIANPAKAKKASDMSAVDVAKGTKLKQLGEYSIGGQNHVKAETIDGTKQYFLLVVDLKDTGDGGATVDVPVPQVFVNASTLALFKDMEMKEKIKDLAANTRMQNTLCTVHGSYGMKIVDGADIGLSGYVDQTKVAREK